MHLNPRQIEVMDEAMAEVYRKKTAAERLRIANEMYLFARRMIHQQYLVSISNVLVLHTNPPH